MNKHLLRIGFTLALAACAQSGHASPWVEADDAFLRADIQLLADSGLLTVPTNTYPVRWSLLADQFGRIDPAALTASQRLAYRHVQYMLDGERLGRGRTHLALVAATNESSGQNGFGGSLHTRGGIQASHEIMQDSVALRIAPGIRQADDSSDRLHLDGSYLAWAAKDVSLSLGWLERWWGPGWQQALGFGQATYPVPALSLSYLNPALPGLGSFWLETLVGKQDNDAADDALWANRLAFRPASWVQMGLSYKQWWGGDSESGAASESQQYGDGFTTADLRLASQLPGGGAGGLYGEWGQPGGAGQSTWILGSDAQWLWGKESVRWVLEYLEQTGADDTPAFDPRWLHKQGAIMDLAISRRLSLGSYWQLHNDHQFSLFYHREDMSDAKARNRIVGQYRLPLFAGLLTWNIESADKASDNQDRFSSGLIYEYRFN